jgi:hypothetical protein
MFVSITRSVSVALAVTVFAIVGFAVRPSAVEDEDDHTPAVHHAHDPTDIWAIARGGQLYDNWMTTLEADEPAQYHRAYPTTGKKGLPPGAARNAMAGTTRE